MATPVPMDAPEERPPAALRAAVAADFERLQRRRRRAVLGLGGLMAAALGGLALLQPGHPATRGGLGVWVMALQGASGLAVVSAALGWPTLRRQALRRNLAAVGLFGLALMVPLVEPVPADSGHGGLLCLVTGGALALGLAVGTALAAGRLLRRHAPVGLMLGLGCGVLAWGPMHLMCRQHDAGHLLLGHGLVPALAVATIGLAARIWRRWAERA